MTYEILHQPSYAVARVMLQAGESILAESGAMMSMSPNINVESKATGGIGKALGRLLGGESIFQTTFTATQAPGEVLLAPTTPGDIIQLKIAGSMNVQSGSFLCCDPHIQMSTKASGRSFFSGEGLFLLNLQGNGDALVNAFGAIVSYTLQPGQQYIVDTGHLVAFSEGMGYEVRTVSKSLFGSMKSGEGFVVVLTGPGTIHLQTRTPVGFAGWIRGMIPSG